METLYMNTEQLSVLAWRPIQHLLDAMFHDKILKFLCFPNRALGLLIHVQGHNLFT